MDILNFMAHKFIMKIKKSFTLLNSPIIRAEFVLEKASSQLKIFVFKAKDSKQLKKCNFVCLCFLKIYMEDIIKLLMRKEDFMEIG